MSKYYYSLSVLFSLVLISCGSKDLRPKDYVAHIKNPENGYVKIINKNALRIECMYKPIDYEVANRLKKDNVSAAEYDGLKKEMDGNIYYELLIHHTKKPTDNMKMYIDYYLERDIYFVNGKDTLTPNSYMVEPYNGITPYQRVLFSFPIKNTPENYSVLIDSSSAASIVKAQFEYRANDINEVALKLND